MNTDKPRRPRRPAGQRAKPITATCEGAFEDGKSEIEGLKEEIEGWKDSLESNGMEHLPKYEELEECYGELESGSDTLEGIDFPSVLSDVQVSYTQDTRQQAQSRSGRLSNAMGALEAAKSEAESWLENNPELEVIDSEDEEGEAIEPDDNQTTEQADADQRETDRSEVEEFINQMDEAISSLENVNFPGMY